MTVIGAEQRKHRRFEVMLPVRVRPRERVVPGPIETSTKDVSATGVYFTIAENVDVGSDLEWEITLPPELSQGATVRIRCHGKIVRVERPDAAGRVGVAASLESYKFIKE